jgi:hypothetical protein
MLSPAGQGANPGYAEILETAAYFDAIGDFDKVAIRYGYARVPAGADARAFMDGILAAAERDIGYVFLSDQDNGGRAGPDDSGGIKGLDWRGSQVRPLAAKSLVCLPTEQHLASSESTPRPGISPLTSPAPVGYRRRPGRRTRQLPARPQHRARHAGRADADPWPAPLHAARPAPAGLPLAPLRGRGRREGTWRLPVRPRGCWRCLRGGREDDPDRLP